MINNRIEKEMLMTAFPYNKFILKKNLKKQEIANYLELYNAYRELLTNYLIDKMNLTKYDKKITESKLNFTIVEKEKMDIYQYFSANQLNYFYIRNNIYIEKLVNEDKEFLLDKIQNNNYNIDNRTKKFLERTYKKVIMEDVLENGKECITLYGPDSSKFMAKNNNIIIGFRFDDFYNMRERKNFAKEYKEQLMFIKNIINEMKAEYDYDVTIIEYNDFCVKKI